MITDTILKTEHPAFEPTLKLLVRSQPADVVSIPRTTVRTPQGVECVVLKTSALPWKDFDAVQVDGAARAGVALLYVSPRMVERMRQHASSRLSSLEHVRDDAPADMTIQPDAVIV